MANDGGIPFGIAAIISAAGGLVTALGGVIMSLRRGKQQAALAAAHAAIQSRSMLPFAAFA